MVKRNCKRVIAFVLALILMLSLGDYSTPLNVYGTQSDESTTNLTKTATGEGDEKDRIYKLSFTANFKDVLVDNKEKFPIDVILLIDMSTSMTDPVKGTNKNRLEVMKDVATNYVDDLAAYCDKSTLSIATYYNSSDIISYPVMVNSEDNKNVLKAKIASIDHKKDENTGVINQLAGTNHDYGFMRAKELLEGHLKESDNQKYIILLTDGAPNAENRDDNLDKALYKEYELEEEITYTKWDDEAGEYKTHSYTLKHREVVIQDGKEVIANGIQSRNVLRDYCVVTMLNQINRLDDKVKVATVGFETLYEETDLENLTDEKRKEALSNMRHIQDLFDVATGATFNEDEGAYVGANKDYQFYTNSTTSLESIFDKLLENFAEENTKYSSPTVIDYIAEGFVPLNDAREQITVEQARTGVTLLNGAEVKYDEGKSLYYVVWPVGAADGFDINAAWASEVYIQAKDDFVGGEDIPTNAEGSGVYVDGKLIEEFPIPTVDVYVREYDVTYEFVSGTPGKTLPQEVMNLKPSTQEKIKDGSDVNPTAPTQREVEDADADGRWVFRAWDEDEKTISGADLTFTGTWEYVPNPSYDVTHSFVSGTAEKELPQEVINLQPSNQLGFRDGETVRPTVPTQTEVVVDGGKWVFKSWDETEKTVSGTDVNFEGTWEFVEFYEVTYSFVSGTEGKELPQAVKDLVPEKQTEKTTGSKVNPTDPTPTEVIVDGGKWVFKGWDVDEKTVSASDVNFEGTWEFVEFYEVTHSFVSETSGKELPQSVKDLCPGKQTGKISGSEVSPTAPTKTEVVVDGGKWVFKGWDADKKTIDGANETFTGSWEYIENTYDVKHSFVSGTDGKELPQSVKDLCPENQTGKITGSEVRPTDPTQSIVLVDGGKWVFKGWDATSKEINGADQSFTGSWEYIENTYEVTHSFVSGTSGKELPQEVIDLCPGNQSGKTNESTVTPTDPTQSIVLVDGGKWVFKGWDATSKEINGADQSFTGSWEYIENTYEVTHSFVSGTSGKELPQEVIDLCPGNQSGKTNGSTVTPTYPTETEVEVDGGKWVFSNWDATSKEIDGANQNFTGTWEYIENTYEVTHSFVSGTSGKELPQEVVDLCPGNQSGKTNGSTVTPTEPEQRVKEDEDGRWIFRTWDADEKTINGADQSFVGTWEYVPNPSYDVTHKFESGTTGKTLPQEVMDLLPSDQLGFKNGDVVNPIDPTQTEVVVDGGKWVFSNWDATSKEIDGSNQSFTGTWEYVENTYEVTHSFVSGTAGKDLPQAVKDLLPGKQIGKTTGSKVNPTDPTQTEVVVDGGKWEFKNWDADEKTISTSDVNFKGTWEFVELYDVTHNFVSGTSGKELPQAVKDLTPGNQTGKTTGSKVNPTSPTQTEVVVDGGKWEFKSWDADEKTVNGADQTFTGIWVYTENTYEVTHSFISGTEGKELPQAVKDLVPGKQTGKKNGSTVTPSTFEKTEVLIDGGKWSFVKWDATNKVIDGANQTFTGTWVYTETEVDTAYDVIYSFVSGTSGKELPKEVIALLPSDKNNIADGTVVTPETLASMEIVVEGGKWVFKLWDAEQKEINGADEEFVGTWVFIETVPETPAEPEAPNKPVAPPTGNNINVIVWYTVSIIALLAMVCAVLRKKNVLKSK